MRGQQNNPEKKRKQGHKSSKKKRKTEEEEKWKTVRQHSGVQYTCMGAALSLQNKHRPRTTDRQTDRHKGTMQKVEQSKGMPANKRKNTVVWTRQKTKAQQHPHVQRLWA